ncbi:MAG: M24 family metallopeptidase [Gracilibacteraceae bacterium]|jgi:Xaa-Pro aminopeptidase|nr:M24 family metallopeptidase [Gracilibacteraceae bacterium]
MTEAFHERLKAPIPTAELRRRSAALTEAMRREGIDCVLAQNITQYLGGCNRWLTDTTAENQYPQSSFLSRDGEIGYIACSGPPLDLYPPSHLLRIGKPWAAAPYFSVFKHTHDWEGRLFTQWALEHKIRKLGVAGLGMFQWNYYDYIARHLPDVEIVDAAPLFDALRALKSQDEIACLKASAAVEDKIMAYIPAFAQPGVREYELRSKIMQLVTDLGGEEMIVLIGSSPAGERPVPLASFFQNRTLARGDSLYICLSASGPGGMFTTVGRMFSVGAEPAPSLRKAYAEAVRAEEKLSGLLQIGQNPQVVFALYNEYLGGRGLRPETGLFAFGQGYDHVERPSIQPGETMPLAPDMCLAVNAAAVSADWAGYSADTFLLRAAGPVRLNKTPLEVFRT